MENIKDIITSEVIGIIGIIIATFLSWLGLRVKNILGNFFDTKTKTTVALTVVQAIEQMYKDLNGEDKLEIAIENISELLADKGIKISENEIRLLIESAVKSVNDSWSSIKGELIELDGDVGFGDLEVFDPNETMDDTDEFDGVEAFIEDNDAIIDDEDDDTSTDVKIVVDAHVVDAPADNTTK